MTAAAGSEIDNHIISVELNYALHKLLLLRKRYVGNTGNKNIARDKSQVLIGRGNDYVLEFDGT